MDGKPTTDKSGEAAQAWWLANQSEFQRAWAYEITDGLGLSREGWKKLINRASEIMLESKITDFSSDKARVLKNEVMVPQLWGESKDVLPDQNVQYQLLMLKRVFYYAIKRVTDRRLRAREVEAPEASNTQVSSSESTAEQKVHKTTVEASEPSFSQARSPITSKAITRSLERPATENLVRPSPSSRPRRLDSCTTIQLYVPEDCKTPNRSWLLSEILEGQEPEGGWTVQHLSYQKLVEAVSDLHKRHLKPIYFTKRKHRLVAQFPGSTKSWAIEDDRDLKGVVAGFVHRGSRSIDISVLREKGSYEK